MHIVTRTQGEEALRGKPVSIARRKADLVLVAARYGEGDHRIEFAQGFQRMGPVWSDLKLFRREDLLRSVLVGRRVYAGRTRELARDFELLSPVRIQDGETGATLLADGVGGSTGDDLALPHV